MRRPPPTVPGMPRQEFEPGDAGLAAGQRDVEIERAGAGARHRCRRCAISTKPRPRRITTPSMPPSRTSRFEATPITVTGTSVGLRARKPARSSISAGRNMISRGAADAEPGDRRERRIRRSGGRAPAAGARSDRSLARRAAIMSAPPAAELVELAGQAVRPVGDRAGAEADDEVAGLGHARDHRARAASGAGSGCTLRWPRARRPATSASRLTPSIGCSPAA